MSDVAIAEAPVAVAPKAARGGPRKTKNANTPKSPKSPKSPAARAGKTAKAAQTAAANKIPKVKKVKVVADHPAYLEMVTAAITELNERKGASHQAILKTISKNHNLINMANTEKSVRSRLAIALKKGIAAGTLLQVTGNGANGRFKLQKAGTKAAKTSAEPSTPKSTKKPAAAVTPSSEKKPKSPVAAKPVAKKSVKSPAAKKTTKAPAAKKTTTKKATA
ncbi:hypothetical protein B9Z55_009520 [Caenorhabditis nigoni]|uniref:H15 domain-containing protein n=1 Tax=Caenorhabditis nigoni TaxID=1611254 RepID=A0A2G5USB7_9PELO|nr:hypothetical protein B9Z55_009520 [Caenorhabditis nigoni]